MTTRPAEAVPAPDDVGALILGLMSATKDHLLARVAAFGLTQSQAEALRHLGESRSQRELARCLHFDASNVTDIADRLEERGLVERQVDPSDRRIRRLVLTPEGVALRQQLFARFLEDAPFMQSLTAEERRTLRDLLTKMVEPFELPGGPDAPPGPSRPTVPGA
jgi:DNA-binding MarR family transcriptional regulator